MLRLLAILGWLTLPTVAAVVTFALAIWHFRRVCKAPVLTVMPRANVHRADRKWRRMRKRLKLSLVNRQRIFTHTGSHQ